MKIENVTLILADETIHGMGVGPHGVIGITSVAGGRLVLQLTGIFILIAPFAHSDSLLHHIVVPGEVRV